MALVRGLLARRGGGAIGFAFSRRVLYARAADGRRTEVEIPGGMLEPSPTEPNFRRIADAARLMEAGVRALAGPGPDAKGAFRRAVIALPDLSVAVSVLPEEGDGGGFRGRRRMRERLREAIRSGTGGPGVSDGGAKGDSPGVPTGSGSDGVGFRLGTLRFGAWLGAMVRKSVVAQYEGAAAALGLEVPWVDGGSLAALPEWLVEPGTGAGRNGVGRILILLQERHFAVASARGGRLESFRVRLRSEGDPGPPAEAALRLREAGCSGPISVLGPGAGNVRGVLSEGEASAPGAEVAASGGDGSSAVAERALAALLRRVGASPAPPRGVAAPMSGGSG